MKLTQEMQNYIREEGLKSIIRKTWREGHFPSGFELMRLMPKWPSAYAKPVDRPMGDVAAPPHVSYWHKGGDRWVGQLLDVEEEVAMGDYGRAV